MATGRAVGSAESSIESLVNVFCLTSPLLAAASCSDDTWVTDMEADCDCEDECILEDDCACEAECISVEDFILEEDCIDADSILEVISATSAECADASMVDDDCI